MSSRPRGRPRSFDPDLALKAASERFRTAGLAGTSLDELAQATGLNRPSLYAAFGDKQALYLAALDAAMARAERGFDRLLAARLPVREALHSLFAVVIDGYLTGEQRPSGCLVISTASAAAVADEAVRKRVAAFVALEDRRIAELLSAAGDQNADAHARLVAATIHSLSVRARAGTPRADLDRMARECIDLVAP